MRSEGWMWLAEGLGYGSMNAGSLLAAYPGGPEAVQGALGSAALDELLTQKQANRLAQSRPADFSLRLRHAEAAGIAALGFDDPLFPEMLRRITNPPPVIFVKGDASLLNGQLAVAIVGARRPSAYGVEVVRALGRGIALGGAIIVSGLAAGLDAEAHKAALAVNGPTVAFIAFGHDNCYPAQNRKLMEVIERSGAVVSEYPPGTSPEKPYFLHRNRLIAGFAHGLVVAEARKHSGTMSTVNFATDYGRDVFAVPGSVFSELSGGTNAMIREGAFLAGSAGDVLSVYGITLPGEDPVAAAAKKPAEARPAPADAGPAWAQPAQPQSLGEALRGGAAAPGSHISAGQAMEAFRALQSAMLPAGAEQKAAAAAAAERKPARSAKKSGEAAEIEPFPWHRVERLSKREVEDLSAAVPPPKPSRKRQSLGSRLFGLVGERADAPAAPPPATETPAAPPRDGHAAKPPPAQSDPAPPPPAADTAPRMAGRTDTAPQAAAVTAPEIGGDVFAAPAAPPRDSRPPAAARPQRKAAEPKPPEPPPPAQGDPWDEAERRHMSLTSKPPLSDISLRALEQLSPRPVGFSELCEKSGLSPAEAMAALTELELAGLSHQLPGRRFATA